MIELNGSMTALVIPLVHVMSRSSRIPSTTASGVESTRARPRGIGFFAKGEKLEKYAGTVASYL
jgi:hypothetical protein